MNITKTVTVDTRDIHFFYMKDNHTFVKVVANTLLDVVSKMKQVAKKYPYGMVCSVGINDSEGRQITIGECCHVKGDGSVNLVKWYNDLKASEYIAEHFNNKVS